MQSYFDHFPDKGKTELRTATFMGLAGDPIPAGTYLFYEYYCTDSNCDCQMVTIHILRSGAHRGNGPDAIATFGYTWNFHNPDPIWDIVNSQFPNPYLNPLYDQASYADELMSFWTNMVNFDRNYAERLQRHYAELRAACSGQTQEPVATRVCAKADRRQRQRQLKQFNRQRKSR